MTPATADPEATPSSEPIPDEPAGAREGTLLFWLLIPLLGCQAFGPETLRRTSLCLGSAILTILWLLRALQRKTLLLPPAAIAGVLLLIGILTVVQGWRAKNPGDAVTSLCLGLSGPILALSLAGTPSMRRHLLERLPPTVLVVTLVIALAGIWQALDFSSNPCLGGRLVSDIEGFAVAVPSLFTHGNYGGTFAAMLVPLAFVGGVLAQGSALRALWRLALSLLVCYLFLSRSRAGLVAAGASLAVFGFLVGRRVVRAVLPIERPGRGIAWGLLALAVGAVLAWMMMGKERQGWTEHLKTSGTVVGRWNIWMMSLRMIPDHPVFGVGLGNYLSGFYRYKDPDFAFTGLHGQYIIQETPDSALVQVLCEFGPLGLGLLLGLGILALIAFGRHWRVGIPGREGIWLCALAALLAAFITGGAFTSVSTQSAHLSYAWAALGMLAGCAGKEKEMPRWGLALSAVTAAALAGFFLIATNVSLRILPARKWEARFIAGGKKDVEALERSISLYPWDLTRAMRAVQAFLDQGDLERARREARRILSWQPENPHLLGQLGEIESRSGRTTEAEAAYRESLHWAPHWALTRRRLGLLYFGLNRYDDARKEFKALAEIEPNLAEAHYLHALTLGCLGDYEPAIRELRKAKELGWLVRESLEKRSESWLKRPEFTEFPR